MIDEYFVGIDPSLTATGISIISNTGELVDTKLIKTHNECYLNAEQRIIDIYNQFKFVSNIVGLKRVYVEGLSYMSNSPTLFERCGLLYLMLTYLFRCDINYEVIPPTTLKKFITTDGHADKLFIRKVIRCRWEYDFEDDNIADAYGLARMALSYQRRENGSI